MRVRENVRQVMRRIEDAADRTLRDAADIRLVAVTKTAEPELIVEAIEAGVTAIGENRVQEALQKIAGSSDLQIRWHLIGSLQSNKSKKASAP